MSTQDGFSNLLWFIGVVEDRKDPQKLGRIRVRCFDIHPDSKIDVPTSALPWAVPVLGTYNTDYKPPLEGQWVFGFFLDGRDAQHPMTIGIIPGMPTAIPDSSKAFSGGEYPKVADLYQPDIPREARGENIDETSVLTRLATKETNPGYEWSEPDTSYNAKYPYNRVNLTESGHLMEFDDTPGSERIFIEHTSGTFTEMQPNGSVVNKIKGDNYTIVNANDKVVIKGNADVIIEGAKKVTINGNCDVEIDGTFTTKVHGDYKLDVAGDMYINTGGSFRMKSSSIRQEAYLEGIDLYSKKNYQLEAGKDVTLHANTGVLWCYSKEDTRIQSDKDFGLYVAENLYTKAVGKTNIVSTGNLAAEGARIDFNTSGAAGTDADSPYNANLAQRSLLDNPIKTRFAVTKNIDAGGYPLYKNRISEDDGEF